MISCKSQLSEQQLLQGMRVHFRTSTHEKWLLPLCGITLISLFGWQAFLDRLVWHSYLFFLLGIAGITLPLWRIPILKRNIRRMPNCGKTVRWTLDEKSLHGEGDGFTFTQDWSTLFSATITNEGILIYPQKRVFYWVPTEGFSAEEDFLSAAALVASRIKKTKDVHAGRGK
jgi:hypothetical protein